MAININISNINNISDINDTNTNTSPTPSISPTLSTPIISTQTQVKMSASTYNIDINDSCDKTYRPEIAFGRVKIKDPNKINVFDLLMINKLGSFVDKIFFYLDDRSLNTIERRKLIDDYFALLKRFDINFCDSILFYSDYYQIARAYIFYLIKKKKARLNYNTTQKYSDLFTFMKDSKCKVFLDTDTNTNTSTSQTFINDDVSTNVNNNDKKDGLIDRYDYILCDNGWYRDIMIETVMDDSEMIDYVLIDHDIFNNVPDDIDTFNNVSDSITNFKVRLKSELSIALDFHEPEQAFTEIIENLSHIKSEKKCSDKYSDKLLLTDLSLDHILNIGINFSTIETMIKERDLSLDKYIINCDLDHTSKSDNGQLNLSNMSNISNTSRVLVDPIAITLTETKTIMGHKIDTVYLDRNELALLGVDIVLDNIKEITIGLEHIGDIRIFPKKTDDCPMTYQGVFVDTTKKTKKSKKAKKLKKSKLKKKKKKRKIYEQKTCTKYIIKYETLVSDLSVEVSKHDSIVDKIVMSKSSFDINNNTNMCIIVFIKNNFTYTNVFRINGSYYLIKSSNVNTNVTDDIIKLK
jgi:hypothetical protein